MEHRPPEAGHVLQDGVCHPGHRLHHTGTCLLLPGRSGFLCPGFNVGVAIFDNILNLGRCWDQFSISINKTVPATAGSVVSPLDSTVEGVEAR